MKVAVLGGGPAGLYFAISMKLRDAAHDVTVFERNRADDTFGWGVVLSDETLDNLAANDPKSAAAIREHFAYWDDIAVIHKGVRTLSTGHGFCGIGRMRLLLLLQERARELGVDLRFQTEVGDRAELMAEYDLVIAADSARFYTAFINLGLVPEAGSSLILPALLGRQNANRLLLAGDTLTADEAERMGLVAYRCGDDELRDKALELGAKLAAKPPQALQYTKQLTRHGADAIREQIKKESVLFAERMFSDETRAIFDKFLNKK